MAHGFRPSLRLVLLALLGLAAVAMPARAAEASGLIAVVSDIHFNPFATPELAHRLAIDEPKEWPHILASANGQRFSARGEDTNHALLASALGALSQNAERADLVVVSGDLLAHRFEEVAAQVLGTSPTSRVVRGVAAKTALYVADALHTTLLGRAILIALGNNDSECGDYQLEPSGAFLAALRDTVRDLAGPIASRRTSLKPMRVTDFSTWYLADLEQASGATPGEWRRDYVFTQAYGQPTYSAAAVEQITKGMFATGAEGERFRGTFRRLYPVSHGEISAEALPAYACAIGSLAPSSYSTCYCR